MDEEGELDPGPLLEDEDCHGRMLDQPVQSLETSATRVDAPVPDAQQLLQNPGLFSLQILLIEFSNVNFNRGRFIPDIDIYREQFVQLSPDYLTAFGNFLKESLQDRFLFTPPAEPCGKGYLILLQ